MGVVTDILEDQYPTRAQAVLGAMTLVEGWVGLDPDVAERAYEKAPDGDYDDLYGLKGLIRRRMRKRRHSKKLKSARRRSRKAQRAARARGRR